MCGIAGVVGRDSPVASNPEALAARLSALLAHRGPDGEGAWLSPSRRVLLVHRRLAIIDPTASGAQPMVSPDGAGILVFNGEVYNYRELRAALESRGERFGSASDTEVLLRLVARDGPAALSRVRGMFALAYWNERDRSLLVARDRFGIKPLYVAVSDRRIAFASEVRALQAAGLVDASVSPAGVLAFFSWGSIPPPLTWHRDVEALAPGSWRRWRQDGREDHGVFADAGEAYRSDRRSPQPGAAFRESVAVAVRDSVRAHLVADVPVGVFLSGGIDSSAVVSAARSVGASDLQTFTVGFDDRSSEAAFARSVASEFRTRHHQLHLDAPDLIADWPLILARLDQPTVDGVNSFYVSKAVAATGIKAVLSGTGGDELFGGYPSFTRLPRALAAKRALGPLFPVVARLADLAMPARLKSRWRHFATSNGHLAEAYRVQRGFLLPAEIRWIAGPRLLDKPNWQSASDSVRATEEALFAPSSDELPAAAVARLETELYLGSQLLRDIDVMAMAHGLEVRVPFVDHELAASVWPELGFHPDLLARKRALHETLEHRLPDEVVHRPKQGFTLPFARWIGGELKPLVCDGLERLARSGWIARDVPDRVWDLWRSGLVHWSRPWGLAVLGHFL